VAQLSLKAETNIGLTAFASGKYPKEKKEMLAAPLRPSQMRVQEIALNVGLSGWAFARKCILVF
jgi:hypothetical protein